MLAARNWLDAVIPSEHEITQLIARYIDQDLLGTGDARVKDYGIHVWALIAALNGSSGNVSYVAAAYDVPQDVVRAAIAYYSRYGPLVDARIAENSAFFTA